MSRTVTRSGRDAGHTALLAELRDGLARLQAEIPAKFLSDPALHELQARVGEVFAHHQAVERSLVATVLPEFSDSRRVLLCLANALGRTTTVGCVRQLRELRAAMRAQDRLVIGIDLCDGLSELERLLTNADGENAALHRGVLRMLNERFDADFDEALLEYRVVCRPELRRLETGFVARRAHEVTIGGAVAVSLKKRESIVMSVRSTFTRNSLEALLEGVGLELEAWAADDGERYAVCVTVPMRRET
jgi:uncharacterized SAM-dependent methyltransferase